MIDMFHSSPPFFLGILFKFFPFSRGAQTPANRFRQPPPATAFAAVAETAGGFEDVSEDSGGSARAIARAKQAKRAASRCRSLSLSLVFSLSLSSFSVFFVGRLSYLPFYGANTTRLLY
jgi:hypothetical protein